MDALTLARQILLQNAQYVAPAEHARTLALAVITLSAEAAELRRRLNLVRAALRQ